MNSDDRIPLRAVISTPKYSHEILAAGFYEFLRGTKKRIVQGLCSVVGYAVCNTTWTNDCCFDFVQLLTSIIASCHHLFLISKSTEFAFEKMLRYRPSDR